MPHAATQTSTTSDDMAWVMTLLLTTSNRRLGPCKDHVIKMTYKRVARCSSLGGMATIDRALGAHTRTITSRIQSFLTKCVTPSWQLVMAEHFWKHETHMLYTNAVLHCQRDSSLSIYRCMEIQWVSYIMLMLR